MQQFFHDAEPVELSGLVGGINDAAPIGMALPTEATEAYNVEFAKGLVSNRRGRAKIGGQIDPAGAPGVGDRVCYWQYQYRTRSGSLNDRLRVNGTHLYKYDAGTNSWKGIISGSNPGDATDVFGGGTQLGTAVQFNDRIYYADGTVQKRYYGGAILNWSYSGGTMPALVSTGTPAGGSLGAGNYTVVYTYYDPSTGDETNPSTTSASIATAANDKIEFTIPKHAGWTSNYSRIRIYRTTVNGAGAWYYEKQIDLGAHNLATTDLTVALNPACYCSVADSSLGSEVEYDNDAIPSTIGVVFMHDERVIGIDLSSSTVYYSKKGKPWAWPATNAQDLLKEDGHPCAGGFVMFGLPYVFKRGGPGFQLVPHPSLGYQPQQLPARHGMESHWSVVPDVNHVYWVDKDGFVQFNGQQTVNVSEGKIRGLFSTLSRSDKDYIERVYGIHHNQPDRQQISWTFSSLTNDSERILNLFLPSFYAGGGGWHEHSYGTYGIRVFSRYEDPDTRAEWVEAADGNGYSYRLRANISDPPAEMFTDDSVVPVAFRYHTAWLGDGVIDRLTDWVDLVLLRTEANQDSGVIYMYVYADGSSTPFMTRAFTLTDSGDEARTLRYGFTARNIRRLKIGFEAVAHNMDFNLVKIVLWGRALTPMLVGSNTA